MPRSLRAILGLLALTLVLASCANAPENEPGAGASGGGTSVPGSSGAGGSGGFEPNDLVHGLRCGSPSPTPASAGPDTPVSTCVDTPGGMPGSPVAEPVEPQPGMADVAPRGWDTAVASADGRTLTIGFVSGVEPCSVLDHVDVRETPTAVTVTLFEGHDPAAGANTACPDIAMYKSVLVRLDAPLGDREVRDGTD